MVDGLGDVATWVGAVVAVAAAVAAFQQSGIAKRQLEDARKSAREDDLTRRKRTAVDLAQEWCRIEAPSPLSILREALIRTPKEDLERLLAGEPIGFPLAYESEIRSFFTSVMQGHVDDHQLVAGNGCIALGGTYCLIVRNFLTRRLNFLEIVCAAFNEELGEQRLIEQFFGGIIDGNASYRAAVNARPEGWPELVKFYARGKTK